MILSEKIINERKRLGLSQEELANKLKISRQSISKWEMGQSIPDITNIIAMAEIFGTTCDYLLNDKFDLRNEKISLSDFNDVGNGFVSLEEVNSYLDFKKKEASIIAKGVMLCIVSPALLISLVGMAESATIHISEDIAALIGIVVMILFIAIAVYKFIKIDLESKKYEYLEKEEFDTAYGVDGLLKQRKQGFESKFSSSLAKGVVLCIVSILPLITGACLNLEDYVICILVSLLLVIVAIGVKDIIYVSVINSGFSVVLKIDDYSVENKRVNKKTEKISEAYWSGVLSLYLLTSFVSGRWDKTWLIWPVAAVVSGLIKSVYYIKK